MCVGGGGGGDVEQQYSAPALQCLRIAEYRSSNISMYLRSPNMMYAFSRYSMKLRSAVLSTVCAEAEAECLCQRAIAGSAFAGRR